MEIRYSTDAEAFYLTIGQGEICNTAHISDDVMVDTEPNDTVHGIELLCTPAELTEEERTALVRRFPVATEVLACHRAPDRPIGLEPTRPNLGGRRG